MSRKNQAQTLLKEALQDPTGQKMRVNGETMLAEVLDVAARESFAQLLLAPGKLEDTTWISNVDLTFDPTKIEEHVTDELFERALTPFLADDDQRLLKLFEVTSDFKVYHFPRLLEAEPLNLLKETMQKQGYQAYAAIISYDIWDSSDKERWQDRFNPVTKSQDLLEGKLGELDGVWLYTDAFREVHKVLPPGTMYIVDRPERLGTYFLGCSIKEDTIICEGHTRRGWKMQVSRSMQLLRGSVIKVVEL